MFGLIRRVMRSVSDDFRRVTVYNRLYSRYRAYTMIKPAVYGHNLAIVDAYRHVEGCVVECGTWRGGMIAGIAELLGPGRSYYLFDSFEGLPPAKLIDGAAALNWQADKDGPMFHDNCSAAVETAQQAMALSGAKDVHFMKGWFKDTLPTFVPPEGIAVLRLDGDWFDSTLVCLEALYPHMAPKGVIILDDYYTWDGCSRAVHYFLARHGYAARIHQMNGIPVILPNFAKEPLSSDLTAPGFGPAHCAATQEAGV